MSWRALPAALALGPIEQLRAQRAREQAWEREVDRRQAERIAAGLPRLAFPQLPPSDWEPPEVDA